MQIPEVPDRVKEAPAQALRAVFAGIGQLLLIADRIKNSEPGHERAEPPPASHADNASEPAEPPPASHADNASERGEMSADQEDADRADAAGERATPAAEDAREPSAAAPAVLPVPNYDDLSLASLRGRLRNLDQAQLRALAGYERAHAGREAVIAMFERRIVKLDITQD